MKELFILFGFIALLAGCSHYAPKTIPQLKLQIEKKFHASAGDYALAFTNPDDTSQTILIKPDEEFHAASTMKTPVMIEVFNQEKSGRFHLSDSITVHNSFTSIADGSRFSVESSRDDEKKLYNDIGKKRTIRDLIYKMIIKSSNLATDNIVELIGAATVNPDMRRLGAMRINVLRGVEDMKAYDKGLNNTTTARDLMVIYEKLARHEVVSPDASDEMIRVLLDQKDNAIIPALLPSNIRVAHKTGEIEGVRHDSGIVFLPDGSKYVLVMLSKNVPDIPKTEKLMAGISRMIYDFMMNGKPAAN